MNTEGDQGVIRTPWVVIVLACLVGVLVGFSYGVVGHHNLYCGGHAHGAGALIFFACGMLGFGVGAGLVGVCALLVGAKLSRYFSYPFTIAAVGFFLEFLAHCRFFQALYMSRELFVLIWFVCLVFGIGGGTVLVRRIRGYGSQVRTFVAIGAIAMLLIGTSLIRFRAAFVTNVGALLGGLYLAVIGGSLSAVAGAIRINLARRTSPDSGSVENGEAPADA